MVKHLIKHIYNLFSDFKLGCKYHATTQVNTYHIACVLLYNMHVAIYCHIAILLYYITTILYHAVFIST